MSKKDKNKKNPVQAAKPVINKSEAAPEVKQPEKPIEAAIPEVVETPEVDSLQVANDSIQIDTIQVVK